MVLCNFLMAGSVLFAYVDLFSQGKLRFAS
jgi:hypothetical protein